MMNILGSKMLTSALIMKGVSLFLASGRRASEARKRAEAEAAGELGEVSRRGRRKRAPHMDAGSRNVNKLPPKTLEQLRRRTHFNKYVQFISFR
jgi:hypothetical protein